MKRLTKRFPPFVTLNNQKIYVLECGHLWYISEVTLQSLGLGRLPIAVNCKQCDEAQKIPDTLSEIFPNEQDLK